ncbi:membrane protein insertion efficiency factor YidD [Rickettsiales bacterium]|nr:membrane protein insertion efficiency factor YidD [Rickettsiales bacterium]
MKKIFIFPIKIYQYFISPLLGYNKCRFYPTCSNYAISAIKEKGIFRGVVLIIYRILRCNPWGSGGYDPVINDKVKNK